MFLISSAISLMLDTTMMKWSAFKLTLALILWNAVLFSNSRLFLLHTKQYLQWLTLYLQCFYLRISQVNTPTAFSANPCSTVKNSNHLNFYTTSDANETRLSILIFKTSCNILLSSKKKKQDCIKQLLISDIKLLNYQ